MARTGTVTVRCPACGEHPQVRIEGSERDGRRVFIHCSCGVMNSGEIREPFPDFYD